MPASIKNESFARSAKLGEDLESMELDDAIELLSAAVDRQTAAFEGTAAIMQGQQQTSERIIQSFSGAA